MILWYLKPRGVRPHARQHLQEVAGLHQGPRVLLGPTDARALLASLRLEGRMASADLTHELHTAWQLTDASLLCQHVTPPSDEHRNVRGLGAPPTPP